MSQYCSTVLACLLQPGSLHVAFRTSSRKENLIKITRKHSPVVVMPALRPCGAGAYCGSPNIVIETCCSDGSETSTLDMFSDASDDGETDAHSIRSRFAGCWYTDMSGTTSTDSCGKGLSEHARFVNPTASHHKPCRIGAQQATQLARC